MRRTVAKLCQAVFAAGIAAASTPIACAQIAAIDKGHQLLASNGLQIWGLDQGASGFNYNNLSNANFNGVIWSWNVDNSPHPKLTTLSSGQKWGKWVDANGIPASALDALETSKIADLIALQVGDEQQSDLENPSGVTKAWFQASHAGNYFPNQLQYVNSFYIGSDAAYATFISDANPDAISFDAYPFDSPYGSIIFPSNWLSKAGQFRRHALGSYIGATGNTPRPYGMYLQTYESSSEGTRHPSDVEMRWQQFTAWTMGFTFVDAFTVGGSSSLFNGGNMSSPSEPRYSQFKESARQSKNLGSALTHLISYGYGPSIAVGKDAGGAPNPVPGDWLPFNKSNAPLSQQYLTSVSATNIGTKNNGQPGDVYVGFFNPLLASYGDPAGTAYFMVTNALGPYLDDPSATVADCMQRITLDFDFGASSINSLQRLRRSDGQVEVVPLSHLSGNQYELTFDLEGGTGDLFKYNDGTPFVGVQLPVITKYWDSDATAGNNNLTNGAGLGGSGNWDNAASKWYNGSSTVPWATNNHAVFWGTAGTVTLTAPQSATSLTFKTSGYTVTGSALTMSGPSIMVDAGATATISSTVAGSLGLAKNGVGTLNLTTNNSYTGGTAVNAGTLQVSSDGNLGAAPAVFTAGNVTLNGGALRFGGSFDLNNFRGITLGAEGGTIDTQAFTNPAGYNASQGGFRGPGDLTKLGTGTFFAAATTGGANVSWTGRLIIKEGTWKIVATDGLPYNAPNGDPLQAAQITLDGGTWQIGATISASNALRGVTVAAGGGTIDTQAFNLTWAGPLAGSVSAAALNKIGSGLLRLNSTAVFGPATYAGALNVNGGTLQLDGGTAMGDLAAINLANTAGVAMTISGASETIGSLSGGGAAGGNVTLSSSLVTGGNNTSTTFNGLLSSAGALTKSGSGTFTLARAAGNSYTGGTIVNGGTLLVNNSASSGTGTGSVMVNTGAVLGGTGMITGAVTVNSGGHIAPGASIELLDVGSLTLSSGSILDFELGTILGVDTSDLINVTSANGLRINGATLNLTNAASMTGGTYILIDYSGTLNGSVSNITMGITPSEFTYSLVNNTSNNSIDLVVTAPGLPGDYNGNGVVDAADYILWRKGLGTTYTQEDYGIWRAHFGQTAGSGSSATAAVPEPTTLVLMMFAAAGWCLGRGRSG